MARQAYRLTNNSSWVPQLAPYDTRRNKQISAFIHSSFSQSPGVALLLGWSHLPLRKKFRANTPPGGRQLKLRREQKQQAAERRACAEGNCAPLVLGNRAPLLRAHRVRPEAGGAWGAITPAEEDAAERCHHLLLLLSPNPKHGVQVFACFVSLSSMFRGLCFFLPIQAVLKRASATTFPSLAPGN